MLMINKWIFDFKWKISWKEKWSMAGDQRVHHNIPIVLLLLVLMVCAVLSVELLKNYWQSVNGLRWTLVFFARFHESYKNTDTNIQRLISHRSNIGSFFACFFLPSFVSMCVCFFFIFNFCTHIREYKIK